MAHHHFVSGLTEEQEDKILRLHILDELPQTTLAERFNKHQGTIRYAILNATRRLLLAGSRDTQGKTA